jgi:hypothetical protein
MFTQEINKKYRYHRSPGQVLVIVLVMMAALIVAGTIMLRIVFSERSMAELYVQKEQAFYIAEAGLEDAKATISKNPSWFTDNPHSPADDASWVINIAKGSIKSFGGGSYKMVRSSGSTIIYSVGYMKNAKSIVRVKFISGRSTEFKIL